MKKVLYVGHAFHLRTSSTKFLLEILTTVFEVQTLVIDPDLGVGAFELLLKEGQYDYVVILQMDFLAPIFLAQGLKTIVIPMYDGSATMPRAHWRISKEARYIAFSRRMHLILQRAEVRSELFKYFPVPYPKGNIAQFSQLNGFLWQRRPIDGISFQTALFTAGAQLDSLHVHLAPDNPKELAPIDTKLNPTLKITQSTWFKHYRDYERVFARSNVFFAPRMAEGIGMGFLEAMSRGMLVLAPPTSTHDEYLCNWTTGILYRPGTDQVTLDRNTAQIIGKQAWEAVCRGRQSWEASIPRLLSYILETPAPTARRDAERLARELPKAYFGGMASYTAYLEAIADEAKPAAAPVATRPSALLSPPARALGDLDKPFITFQSGGARAYLDDGWSGDEPTHTWMLGHHASLSFAGAGFLSQVAALTIECRSIARLGQSISLTVIINDRQAGSFKVGRFWKKLSLRLKPGELGPRNVIKFYSSEALSKGEDQRQMSIAFRLLEFV